jgi:GNAT superfamily N-acetyltransferase
VYLCEPFNESHDLSQFACGNESMDNWLRSSALRGEKQKTGRTYVWCNDGEQAVLAYFTLAANLIERDSLGLSRSKSKSLPSQLPAILLARLALHVDLRGQGLGQALLANALTMCVAAGDIAAARYVVVDAIDDAAIRFYAKFGFQLIRGSQRMTKLLSDIAQDLAE